MEGQRKPQPVAPEIRIIVFVQSIFVDPRREVSSAAVEAKFQFMSVYHFL